MPGNSSTICVNLFYVNEVAEMTFVKTLISRSVLDIVHKKLGPGDVVVTKDDQSCSLIRHREDHVWIWNAKGKNFVNPISYSWVKIGREPVSL